MLKFVFLQILAAVLWRYIEVNRTSSLKKYSQIYKQPAIYP